MRILFLILFSCLTASAALNNPPTSVEKQFLVFKNEITNPGFESGLTGWSWTTTAPTVTTTSGEVFEGSRALEWDAAGSDKVCSNLWAVKDNSTGNSVAFARVQTSDADYDFEIQDSSNNVIVEADISASTQDTLGDYLYQLVTLNFVAQQGTSYKACIVSAGDESEIRVDSTGLGYADGYNLLGQYSTAQFVGESYIAATTNCQWGRANTVVGQFTTDTDCPGPTIVHSPIGSWQTTDSDLPRQTINSLPAGYYKVTASFSDVPTANNIVYAISDGTTIGKADPGGNSGSVGSSQVNVTGWFEYTSTGDRSFEIYAAASSGTASLKNSITTPSMSLRFFVEYFPLSSKQIYTTDQSDYGPTAFTPTISAGFGTVTNNSGFHWRTGNFLFVRGSFTAGTVAASLGTITLPNSLSLDTTKISISNTSGNPGPIAGKFGGTSANVSGHIVTATGTSSTLVYFSSNINNAPITPTNVSTWLSSSVVVSYEFSVPISGWVSTNRAPQLVNGVISKYPAVSSTESALVVDGSSTTTVTDDGDWINGACTNGSAGTYVCTFSSGVFSARPNCWANAHTSSSSYVLTTVSTSTTVSVYQRSTTTGNLGDGDFVLYCKGPK